MLHVRKDDEVMILAGKDRGKTGKVLRVFPSEGRAIVEHTNVIRRHTRPNPQRNVKGGIVDRESPLNVSNLMVICRECSKPSRVGYSLLSDGKKVRTCRNCGGTIDK